MITVDSINIAPVKSLGLAHPDKVRVESEGIIEDRRILLADANGTVLTQRQVGPMVQVKADYTAEPEWLRLRFPNGSAMEDPVEVGDKVTTRIFGRAVAGRIVTGKWDVALSDFCGQPLSLIRSDLPGQCYDEFPVSILSQTSVENLDKLGHGSVTITGKRFRPNFLLAGCQPHEEDTWLGRVIRIGDDLLLRVVARDPRCAITTHDPETGARDVDTLRLILSYRPNPRAPYFGVYGIVERPGDVSLGDQVTAHSPL